ncbi:hypothetical protein D4764_04G0013060 [Takifugu flavidus]|uniref:Brinker DNA-binding domain-containing protein n=1 Tax=Takifugu flavidus TaxID=433684 RepID=A0A5C6N6Z5_9TELE|nr:hypothetical protein D4764_04G0013060 [Takifugu flavidus]
MAPVKRHAYEAYFKLQAIEYTAENGNRAAARHFNVNESMVRKWRKQERASLLSPKAKAIAEEIDIEHFQGGPSWCFRFMRRRYLSIRARTTVVQRLPADYQERAAIFRTYCCDKITPPSHIYEAVAGKLCQWRRVDCRGL